MSDWLPIQSQKFNRQQFKKHNKNSRDNSYNSFMSYSN